MDTPIQPRNNLLRSLTEESFDRLKKHLTLVPLMPKRVLTHARLTIEQVHFIEVGLVSVDASTNQENQMVESWLVGPDGFVGVPVALGVTSSPHRRVVLTEGSAWVMKSAILIQAMETLPEFRRVVLRYIHSVLVQTAQLSACNARHPLRDRVARILLMTDDRLESPSLTITHDVIAKMIGVRRASVTDALQQLEQAGAIRVERGQVTVADRSKLESLTCHCYAVLKGEFLRPISDDVCSDLRAFGVA